MRNRNFDTAIDGVRKQHQLLDVQRMYFGGPPVVAARTTSQLSILAKSVAEEAKQLLQARGEQDEPSGTLAASAMEAAIEEVESRREICLQGAERRAAFQSLAKSLEDYSVLGPLLEDESVNDIIVGRFDDVSIQSGRKNLQTDIAFDSQTDYLAFLDKLLARSGQSCTHSNPVVDIALGANLRACITHQSFSPPEMGPTLTIRIARHAEISSAGLIDARLAPKQIIDYLRCLTEAGTCSLLIAGEVGTGKTTLVRALASHIPEREAVLIIEDTYEIVLNRKFSRTLLTRSSNSEGQGYISAATAIRAGMRMAMNRIILGEMRDAESAEAFVDVATSGHSGLSTIHAKSARDALSRLELFLLRAQSGVSADTARRQLAQAVGVLVHLGIDEHSGERRIQEVVEVQSFNEGVIQLVPVFSYQSEVDSSDLRDDPRWKVCTSVSQYRSLLERRGYRMPVVNSYCGF